jgi:hypothetical protein
VRVVVERSVSGLARRVRRVAALAFDNVRNERIKPSILRCC